MGEGRSAAVAKKGRASLVILGKKLKRQRTEASKKRVRGQIATMRETMVEHAVRAHDIKTRKTKKKKADKRKAAAAARKRQASAKKGAVTRAANRKKAAGAKKKGKKPVTRSKRKK